tara:strand:+ start:204 stop:950 length:747 start_codon:yes stop_codon:yes gene_type:complete
MIQNLGKFLNYPYKYKNTLAPFTIMFLVFYGGLASPKLPKLIKNLFMLPIFRIFILSLIVYKGNKNPTLSLVVAIGFVLIMDKLKKEETFSNTINHINKQKIKEEFAYITGEEKTVDCAVKWPMPGRKVMAFLPDREGSGVCKIRYFKPPGWVPDCSICQNPPDPNKIVDDCNIISDSGICVYEYADIDEQPEDEFVRIDSSQIEQAIDKDVVLQEIQGIFSDLEQMQVENNKELKKINELKIADSVA